MPANMDFDTEIIYVGVLEVKKTNNNAFSPALGRFRHFRVRQNFFMPCVPNISSPNYLSTPV